jgi:nicotinate-nucleotide adenylyltransferase
MAALGAAGQHGLGVSDFEISRDTPSYTIETVRHFTAMGHEVTLIMGSDSLADIESWRDYRELLDRARVMVYPRQPATAKDLANHLPAWVRDRVELEVSTIEVMNEPLDTVSSSEIRERIRSGRPLEGMVPPAVEEYIRRQGLYVTGAVPGEAGD